MALSARGLDVVHEVSHRQTDPHERWTAVRGALLDWLGDRYLRGEPEPQSWEESFRTTRWGMFLGEPFTDDELTRGMESLVEDGDVAGIELWGRGTAIARPKLTAQGRAGVLGDWDTGGAGRHGATRGGDTHFHGPVTGAQVNHGSTGSVQKVHVTGDQLAEIRRLVAAVTGRADLAADAEVSGAVAVVEDAVDEEPVDPSRLRRVVDRLGDKVLDASVGAVTVPVLGELGRQLHAAAQAIGH